MATADEIRDAQRVMWAKCSPGWDKWDPIIADQLGPVGEAMIASLDVSDDQLHLDIAAGTGEPGLSIARSQPMDLGCHAGDRHRGGTRARRP